MLNRAQTIKYQAVDKVESHFNQVIAPQNWKSDIFFITEYLKTFDM